MNIKVLIEYAIQLLKDAKYTNSRIYTYRWLWSKGIIPFMESRGLKDYSEDVGKQFMLTCHGGSELTFHHRDLVKSADILTKVLLYNNIGCRMSFLNPYPLEGEVGDAANRFLEHKKELKNKQKTIRSYSKRLSNFVEFLDSHNMTSLCDITEEIIIDYISKREYRQVEYVRTLKRFLTFLFKQKLYPKTVHT